MRSRPDEPGSAGWLLRRTPPSDPPRQRGGPRWVFPASLAISALLHLIALLVLSFESELVPVSVPGDPVVRGPPVGMVVYDIEPVEEADGQTPEEAQRPARRIQEPEPGPPVHIPAVRPEPAPSVTAEPRPPSARVPGAPNPVPEHANPRMGDPRLWDRSESIGKAPGNAEDAVPRRITIDEWNGIVNPRPSFKEFNDSIRLAEERAAKAVDWTVKTGNGRRWGVTPKGIHLGSFILPIPPIHFVTPPGRREGAGAAQRSWSEIQAQRGTMVIQEDIKDRIKAIRERREAERRDSTRRGGG